MTPYDGNFLSEVPYNGSTSIVVGNGTRLPIKNIVNCILSTSCKPLKLDYISHVPALKHNLILIKRLCRDNNCQVIFYASTFSIQNNEIGTVLLWVRSSGDLYPIVLTPPTALFSNHQSYDVWHRRLGHTSSRVLDLLHSNKYIVRTTKTSKDCVSCSLGKSTKLPFNEVEHCSAKP